MYAIFHFETAEDFIFWRITAATFTLYLHQLIRKIGEILGFMTQFRSKLENQGYVRVSKKEMLCHY